MNLYCILGEKKRLTKAAKLKKFSSLKPWIGVIIKINIFQSPIFLYLTVKTTCYVPRLGCSKAV